MAELSRKDHIDNYYFAKYKKLEEKLTDMDWVEKEKEKLDLIIQKLEIEKTKVELERDSWLHKLEREEADVTKLKKMSWSSLKAKISGSHEELLQKEQLEADQTRKKLEATKAELIDVKTKLNKAKQEFSKISEEDKVKQLIQIQKTDVIYAATEGISDEKEDEIELQINELGKIIDPYTMRKSKIQAAFSLLQMSAEYLRDASIRIDKERDKKTQTNALLADTLTKNDAASLRGTIRDASELLNQAYDIMYQQFDDPTADLRDDEEHKGLFQGQDVWQRFMRNFMKDLKKGFRNREETKKQLLQAVADINKLQSWVNSLLNDINYKIEDLMNKLRLKEQDLIKERTRIFKTFYANADLENLGDVTQLEEEKRQTDSQSGSFHQPIQSLNNQNKDNNTSGPPKPVPGFNPEPLKEVTSEDEEEEEEEIDPEDLSDEGIRIKGLDKEKSGFNI